MVLKKGVPSLLLELSKLAISENLSNLFSNKCRHLSITSLPSAVSIRKGSVLEDIPSIIPASKFFLEFIVIPVEKSPFGKYFNHNEDQSINNASNVPQLNCFFKSLIFMSCFFSNSNLMELL